ncbi:PhzF family phenazine biosynthesis protein [Enhydrobacter sp.]|jgi:trans-2,3-dihydro-3-hydroxyanthranilate isomerase|uniref:PhzF family phenazine biosynthesis protein n=1 Tax=Enhydrobacter sp. TaxID=1894999 RepID=UPI002602EE93|nr:PhzF family phenazine biosynthesis protein [Enhydrobacter sp.]WIM10788.1 MAG: Phenazine biosynthesis protein PhzF like [Enhydrobacter sp.]
MRRFSFVTVDVFTERRFGGNPLAVFPEAQGLSDAEMQALAAEFNLSETTFVLPAADRRNTARVRIFNRKTEMPFAGHPNVGTGWVLARHGTARNGLLRFEEIAGLVEVRAAAGLVTIAAPQPLSLGPEMPIDLLAGCVGLDSEDVVVSAHRPVLASVGNSFVIAEVTAAALAKASPDVGKFRDAARIYTAAGASRLPLYLYAREGNGLRARMFSPLSGTMEDAATGSAATPLAALLLSLGTDSEKPYEVIQGVEMGRPSRLLAHARRTADGIRAAVGGHCVPVLEGEVSL